MLNTPSRVLFAGDWHGSLAWHPKFQTWVGWARECVELARDEGCQIVVQCGDFGFWEHAPDGVAFLDGLEEIIAETGIPVVWIDGNHDNHPFLWRHYKPGPDGFAEVRANLYYAPRGHRWEWNGVRFLALGGAYSIDRGWRLKKEHQRRAPQSLYWPTELITDEQVAKALQGGPVDVLISHDAPAGVDVFGSQGRDNYIEFPPSTDVRMKLRRVVEATRPSYVIHGHHHVRNSSVIDLPSQNSLGGIAWHRVHVEGLGADVTLDPETDSVWIVNLAELELARERASA